VVVEQAGLARSDVEPVESMASRLDGALALPAAVPDESPPGFPWIVSCAPVIGALVLWAMTGSPLALTFAALGPIVAVASMIDGRRQATAGRRRRAAERQAALDELQREVGRRHAAERALAWRRTPAAAELLTHAPGAAWRGNGPGLVVIGRGEEPSSVRVAGTPLDEADRALLREAACVRDAPVRVDPRGGLGFVGPPPLARAAARSALVQLAQLATPGTVAVLTPGGAEWAWASGLPHQAGAEAILVSELAQGDHIERLDPIAWHLATAPVAAALPPGLATVVRVEHPTRAVLEREEGRPGHRVIVPELLSSADAARWAETTRAAAARAGLDCGSSAVPAEVAIDALEQPPLRRSDRSTLAVVVGVAAAGPIELDLVRDGPHALVAGTSGSGKSEFLVAWLAALAAVHPPELVAFLLVDFKGGAAFEPLRGLPHVAGLVTDLDEAEAVRAVQSLRAELRHREEVLRGARCRAIAELPAEHVVPRLVIVVDEFQAMTERFPELAPLIGDIASRGRSLGVHLVLAAQRPNGVVRENVTANCGLRISFRVLHRADSLSVLGVDRAAALDPAAPGRAMLARDGVAVEFHSALASPASIERIRLEAVGAPARRPWLDPLPRRLTLEAVHAEPVDADPMDEGPATGLTFGLADDPEFQRRVLAQWRPDDDGPLLVAGRARSGRSTALGAVAAAFAERHGVESVIVLGGPPSTEWDAVHDALARVRSGSAAPRLLVADDLDVRYRSWPEEHRIAMVDAIAACTSEGRSIGLHLAASAGSVLGLPGVVRDLFGGAVLLRQASRSELMQAGGAGNLWRTDETPGAGQWRGLRVQVVDRGLAVPPPVRPVPRLRLAEGEPVAVVSAAPVADAAALAEAGGAVVLLRHGSDAAARALASLHGAPEPAPVVVADAESWAANWALLAAVRELGVVVVRASAAELRAVIRERTPPPMLDPGGRQCWRLRQGQPPARYAWPPERSVEVQP
jgi:S-DNA-T family DNA segregation ATPase FtsK/SpoIIIE